MIEKWKIFKNTYSGSKTGNPYAEVTFGANFSNGQQKY